MKKSSLLYILLAVCISCDYGKPAFRFSNFYGTSAENVARAIEKEDIETIRKQILNNSAIVNFKDKKYDVSLLTLALANDKKKAFKELLKLGADPNIENHSCISPLISAIRYNKKCNLYYIKGLLESGANLTPEFFNKCNYFTYDPIVEIVQYYNKEDDIDCGLKILKLLTSKLNNPNLLSLYNNP